MSNQNTDCGYSLEPPRQGGSKEYPQSMFLSRNKKNNVYPCKPLHVSDQNTDCGYSLEPPRQGGSKAYPQSMFLSRNTKKKMYTPVNPVFTT